MKKEVTTTHLVITGILLLAMTVVLFAFLPGFMPYEHFSPLYGIIDPETKAEICEVPQGHEDIDICISCASMAGSPETWLLINGKKYQKIEGNGSLVRLDSDLFKETGTTVLTLRYYLFPPISITSNKALIEVY